MLQKILLKDPEGGKPTEHAMACGQRGHLSRGVLIVGGHAGVPDQPCRTVLRITLIRQYRFATPKSLRTRPGLGRCTTVPFCNMSGPASRQGASGESTLAPTNCVTWSRLVKCCLAGVAAPRWVRRLYSGPQPDYSHRAVQFSCACTGIPEAVRFCRLASTSESSSSRNACSGIAPFMVLQDQHDVMLLSNS